MILFYRDLGPSTDKASSCQNLLRSVALEKVAHSFKFQELTNGKRHAVHY